MTTFPTKRGNEFDPEPSVPFNHPSWRAWKRRSITLADKLYASDAEGPSTGAQIRKPRAWTHEQIEGDQRRFV